MSNPATQQAGAAPAAIPTHSRSRVAETRGDEPLRGDAALALGDRAWLRAETLLGLLLPRNANPLAWTGALSAWSFFVAAASGVLLLFWYDASVNLAYDSIAAMEAQPWGGGFLRTLHRYSSDACVLFAVLHGLKVLLARRLTGARALAWVSGLLLLGLIWLDGWLGYWLTWDQRAQAVAAASARVLDALPLFPEPLQRSLLTNADVNTLIFFVIFFVHVLLPVPLCILLWIHLVRVRKPRLLPPRGLAIGVTVAMAVLSVLLPAQLAGRADMAVYPEGFDIDWFYLVALPLAERLPGWAFWAVAAGSLVVLSSLPWVLARKRRPPATVDTRRCGGCTQCVQDCPYDAATMVVADGREHKVSLIDPNRCVSCGVCVGSCDPGAIDFETLDRREVRQRIDRWQREQPALNVAFLCADSAGRAFAFNEQSGEAPELPGWRVVGVPCASWLHFGMVEQVTRKGGRVLLSGCGGVEPRCRLGSEITALREAGEREPHLRNARIPAASFAFVEFNSVQAKGLKAAAAKLADGAAPAAPALPLWRVAAGAVLALLVFGGATWLLSDFAYLEPARPGSALVVSFKQAGAQTEEGEAVQSTLPHMQGMKKRVELLPVRLRVSVDGQVVHEASYEARGVRKNSASIAIEELAVAPGLHRVRIEIGSTADAAQYNFAAEETLEFGAGRRRVVQFEESTGFRWE
ncbi:MAG: cytochrome b N-terminal domain-containing protein [Planctomycetes bacterium]|nr:cytochrome b N-terminal domain-containing protein [Planctomycetota bacterium]